MSTISPRERDERRAMLERWTKDREKKLADLPEAVRTEVVATAMTRILTSADETMTSRDVADCASRAATRLRLKRYRRLPDDPDEAGRQLSECRAECGL